MLETAIIGGGVSGLVLARALHRAGQSFALFEARERLGGRALSVAAGVDGLSGDLGPSWYWPQTQPRMRTLISELGLETLAQHDPGTVRVLEDPDHEPVTRATNELHGGARRLVGGMGALVDALAHELPGEALHCGHVLRAVHDCGNHVELRFEDIETRGFVTVRARRVALALPPRLLAEHVRFTPALPAELLTALVATPTWMAAQAKVLLGCERAYWREAGHSGNAFAQHAQAVLAEVWDACDASGGKAALGGFLALGPGLRERFGQGLPLLIDNQFARLFGSELEDGVQHYQDWAQESFTCSTLDSEQPLNEHPDYDTPALRAAYWGGRLHFGGAETAAQHGGYLEGALEAAARIARRCLNAAEVAASGGDTMLASVDPFDSFIDWVEQRRGQLAEDYRGRLNAVLASGQNAQATLHALLGTVDSFYTDALMRLGTLALAAVPAGERVNLRRALLTPFSGCNSALLGAALSHNRSSCALSNFPHEHGPDSGYRRTIELELASAWQDFVLDVDERLRGTQPLAV